MHDPSFLLVVIATDIWDKELKALRSSRWQQSFDKNAPESPMTSESLNRKATVVIDHLIQASDVAHTLSHWYIYQKWNEKLFKEMYFAFLSHRAEKDPSIGWYNGEIWFFDNYVIPLANRLKECGVFGVTGDEFLNYALQNRREWEAKGREVVDAMKRRAIEQAETMNLVRMGVVVEHSEVSMSHFDDEEPYEVQIVSPRRKLVERTTTSILKPGKRIIIAPPGRLGITIDTTESGQVVHSVESDSPLKDQIHSGEYIIAINDVVTKSMSSDAISALLQASVDHEKRFVVEA